MEVKNVDKFLADIDQYEYTDTELIKHDGKPRAIKIHLKKPVSGETAATHIKITHRREASQTNSPFHLQREWYELNYNPQKQGDTPVQAAKHTYQLLYDGEISFRHLLRKPYTLELETLI